MKNFLRCLKYNNSHVLKDKKHSASEIQSIVTKIAVENWPGVMDFVKG